MSTETKVIIIISATTLVLLIGGIWLLTNQSAKEEVKISKSLVGEVIADQGANHIPESTTSAYLTNPPTGGPHYAKSAPGGIYDKEVPDGNLIHSMEHGAVILWYKSDTPATESAKLKDVFNSVAVSKKIMVPKKDLDAPIALTSWGRLLKLQTIDEAQIKNFLVTNENRGPEKAPL